MSNTVDLFSGKDLKEVEAEDQAIKDEVKELFKTNTLKMLQSIKDLVETGDIESICFLVVSSNGVVRPTHLHTTLDSLHTLEFLAEEAKVGMHEDIATCYNLRQFDYIEE